MTVDNVCKIIESSFLSEELAYSCYSFADQNAPLVLDSRDFCRLSMPNLIKIICRDSFGADEVKIVRALHNWVLENPQNVRFVSNAGKFWRFAKLISHFTRYWFWYIPGTRLGSNRRSCPTDARQTGRPGGRGSTDGVVHRIADPGRDQEAARRQLPATSTNRRPHLAGQGRQPGDAGARRWGITVWNIVWYFVGTISLQLVEDTPNKGWTLSSNGVTNDRNLFTFHNINTAGSGIVVQLDAIYLLNRVQLHLYDGGQYSYCYYVEVKSYTYNIESPHVTKLFRFRWTVKTGSGLRTGPVTCVAARRRSLSRLDPPGSSESWAHDAALVTTIFTFSAWKPCSARTTQSESVVLSCILVHIFRPVKFRRFSYSVCNDT